ncbi:MAG: transketolase C-terminal domain-containing protein [Candidatus Paceibacterota bacterium]
MLNIELKLNPKIFEKDVEMQPIRKGFGEGLVEAAEADRHVVGLCADLTESTQMLAFRNKFPERFVEIGVAEQNLAAVASGMAAMGKIPFMTSYATFSPGRNWEQIRTTICYNNQPVKIVGSHAGVSVGPDGGTHQAIEDIAITRVLPRMVVICPCDAEEARKAVLAAAKTPDPTYIRLSREKTPVMTTQDTPFEIGKAAIFFRSDTLGRTDVKRNTPLDVGIIATGALVHKALTAARELDRAGKKVAVMNISTVKPLDEMAVIQLAREAGAIVTVEEHQINGGMGSAVAECLAKNYPVPMEFIGVKDQFGQSGNPDELIEHYGMGESHIRDAANKVMMRNK